MKILPDECITKRLKPYLTDFEVFTVSEMKWNGMKNGKLMALCIKSHFDLLLTIDKNLIFQQSIDKLELTIAVLNSPTSKLEELLLFMPSFKSQAHKLHKYKAYIIEK